MDAMESHAKTNKIRDTKATFLLTKMRKKWIRIFLFFIQLRLSMLFLKRTPCFCSFAQRSSIRFFFIFAYESHPPDFVFGFPNALFAAKIAWSPQHIIKIYENK